MKWIDKLERKFGSYYIDNLMKKIVIITAAVFILFYAVMQDYSFIASMILIPSRVLKGEVWRLATFIFIPPMARNIFWVALILYFQYVIGNTVERALGGFRFNLYFFLGVLSEIIMSFITGIPATGGFILSSIFLAFAKLFPEQRVLFMYIIPVKVKWIGYLTWGGIIVSILMNVVSGRYYVALLAATPIINYLIFFGVGNYRDSKMTINSKIRQREFEKVKKVVEAKPYRHKCTVCGITDADDKNMLFRYCSKCNGEHAYCEKHIQNHEHIK